MLRSLLVTKSRVRLTPSSSHQPSSLSSSSSSSSSFLTTISSNDGKNDTNNYNNSNHRNNNSFSNNNNNRSNKNLMSTLIDHNSHHRHSLTSSLRTTSTLSSSSSSSSSDNNPFIVSSMRYQHQHQNHHHDQNHRRGRRYLSSAFVSRHNHSLNITPDTIVDYCSSHGASVEGARTTSTHVVLRECPFCPKPTRNEASNLYKLHIQIGGGAYFCHRCGTGGSWYDLKAKFGGFNVERGLGSGTSSGRGGGGGGSLNTNRNGNGNNTGSSGYNNNSNYNLSGGAKSTNNKKKTADGTEPCLPMPPARLSGFYSSRLLDHPNNDDSKNIDSNNDSNNNSNNSNSNITNKNDVLRYLTEVRGLNTKTLRKYGVGKGAYQFPCDVSGGYRETECITFPWIMRESDIQLQESLRGATFAMSAPPIPVVPEAAAAAAVIGDNSANDDQEKNKKDKKESTAAAAAAAASETTPGNNMNGEIKDEVPTGAFVTRRIKARALEKKAWQRLDPPGGGWGLFGLHTIPNDATEIVLTEGEYDAMAVSQATGRHAVSLPNGCRSLPVQTLPLLERFDKIYLWMDNDEPGREGAEKFAKKLGVNRTYIVQCLEAKDANDALLNEDIDLNQVIESATLTPHDRIVTFKDLRNDVLQELLEPDQYSGTPVPSLPRFTQIIKGFRRGEMTVLTGPTGAGKTTFLGQVSLDLAEQGENVLWGSFEIKNTRLLHKLMKQFSRDSLPVSTEVNAREKFEALADRFETLPLYFMKFHGGSDMDEVLDAMEYAVYVNDVEHIILDNMQFMITRNGKKSSFDKFEVQDLAIEKFRKFATEHNVHVTLVVHPRKEDAAAKLSISSFFGSAKATQEADTVIIIQNDANRRKCLDVKKNRFDGTLGFSPIYFQSKSGRYVEDEISAGGASSGGGQLRNNNANSNNNNQGEPPKDISNHWDSMLAQPKSGSGRA